MKVNNEIDRTHMYIYSFIFLFLFDRTTGAQNSEGIHSEHCVKSIIPYNIVYFNISLVFVHIHLTHNSCLKLTTSFYHTPRTYARINNLNSNIYFDIKERVIRITI